LKTQFAEARRGSREAVARTRTLLKLGIIMLGSIRRLAAQSFVASVALCLLPLAVQAGTINVILGNMDVSYLGSSAGGTGSFFDAMGGHSGGTQTPGTADEISTATFEFDNVSQGTLVSSNPPLLYGDLKIDGVGATIPKGVFQTNAGNNGGGFGYDFFTSDGYLIQLGIDKISYIVNNGIFFFFGSATLDLNSQALPFGLKFTSPTVDFSFTATSVSLPAGNPINMAMGSGAFTITGEGTNVPEPALATVLASSSLAMVAFASLKRRRSVSRQ
jgi:hypothetical protein